MIDFTCTHRLFSLNQLIQITSQKLMLPFYHTISEQRLPHISNLYTLKTIHQFKQDLEYICTYYQPISIEELRDIVYYEKKITKPIFHLSFDDGLKELYTDIAPILEKKGIPATFFINTDFIDNKALFYRYKVSLIIEEISQNKASLSALSTYFGIHTNKLNSIKQRLLAYKYNNITEIEKIALFLGLDFTEYLQKHKPYLSKNQTKELLTRGFSIGSHSMNHPHFKDIDTHEKKRQIHGSFNYLEKKLDIHSYYFSYPFSDESVEQDFFNWLYYDAHCKLSFGISGLKHDFSGKHLHRIPCEQGKKNVQDILKKEYLYYILKTFFNKNRINRK
ncbi:MAG: polysaccharide deacetylase family protein [Bacteroidales bacterium]